MPHGIELIGVQPPGRESRIREKPIDRIGRLAPQAARFIRPHLDRPYAFFGHSMGALIAYEVAVCLRREGAPGPDHLFVSARRAPSRKDLLPGIHELPDQELLTEVRRRWDGIPPDVLRETELLQLLLPTLRADLAVIETYTPAEEAPIECSISVFGGMADRSLQRDDLLAWRNHTRGRFRLRMLPGGHFFIRGERQALLRAMAEDLDPVVSGARGVRTC